MDAHIRQDVQFQEQQKNRFRPLTPQQVQRENLITEQLQSQFKIVNKLPDSNSSQLFKVSNMTFNSLLKRYVYTDNLPEKRSQIELEIDLTKQAKKVAGDGVLTFKGVLRYQQNLDFNEFLDDPSSPPSSDPHELLLFGKVAYSLQEIIQEQIRLSTRDLEMCLQQVLNTLTTLYNQNIAYANVSLKTIFLAQKGFVISDFSKASLLDSNKTNEKFKQDVYNLGLVILQLGFGPNYYEPNDPPIRSNNFMREENPTETVQNVERDQSNPQRKVDRSNSYKLEKIMESQELIEEDGQRKQITTIFIKKQPIPSSSTSRRNSQNEVPEQVHYNSQALYLQSPKSSLKRKDTNVSFDRSQSPVQPEQNQQRIVRQNRQQQIKRNLMNPELQTNYENPSFQYANTDPEEMRDFVQTPLNTGGRKYMNRGSLVVNTQGPQPQMFHQQQQYLLHNNSQRGLFSFQNSQYVQELPQTDRNQQRVDQMPMKMQNYPQQQNYNGNMVRGPELMKSYSSVFSNAQTPNGQNQRKTDDKYYDDDDHDYSPQQKRTKDTPRQSDILQQLSCANLKILQYELQYIQKKKTTEIKKKQEIFLAKNINQYSTYKCVINNCDSYMKRSNPITNQKAYSILCSLNYYLYLAQSKRSQYLISPKYFCIQKIDEKLCYLSIISDYYTETILSEESLQNFTFVQKLNFAELLATELIALSNGNEQLIHGSLKPSNIFIKDGIPYLMDFGYINLQPIQSNSSDANQSPCFQSFASMSPYLAMEVSQKEYATLESDVWSLGLIFYLIFWEKQIDLSQKNALKLHYGGQNFSLGCLDLGQEQGNPIYNHISEMIKRMTQFRPEARLKLNEVVNGIQKAKTIFQETNYKYKVPKNKLYFKFNDNESKYSRSKIQPLLNKNQLQKQQLPNIHNDQTINKNSTFFGNQQFS